MGFAGGLLSKFTFGGIERNYSFKIQLENMDKDDVLSYIALEKDAENKKYWSCAANALVYKIYEAYNFENESYLPQTIESVDSDTIKDFINNFNNITNKPSLSHDFIEHILEISNMDIENRIINAKQFLIKQLGSWKIIYFINGLATFHDTSMIYRT